MKLSPAIAICLCLQLFACTKKKAEAPSTEAAAPAPAPSPTDPIAQQAVMTTPEHLGIPLVSDPATGEMRNVFQLSPREQQQLASLQAEQGNFSRYKSDTSTGKKVYAQHCASCHGPDGRGNGPAGESLPIAPTNFHEWPIKYGSNLGELALSVMVGRGEGAMPAYGATLSKDEFWAVSYLIDSWVQARTDLKK